MTGMNYYFLKRCSYKPQSKPGPVVMIDLRRLLMSHEASRKVISSLSISVHFVYSDIFSQTTFQHRHPLIKKQNKQNVCDCMVGQKI